MTRLLSFAAALAIGARTAAAGPADAAPKRRPPRRRHEKGYHEFRVVMIDFG